MTGPCLGGPSNVFRANDTFVLPVVDILVNPGWKIGRRALLSLPRWHLGRPLLLGGSLVTSGWLTRHELYRVCVEPSRRRRGRGGGLATEMAPKGPLGPTCAVNSRI